MDLNWLQDFSCLARTLNFTQAAVERCITQSAFSRRIKSLEIWIGVPLIDRSSFPIQLTEAGQQFLPIAKQTALQLIQARDELRAQDSGDGRFYRFAAQHTISVNFLAERICALEEVDSSLRTRVVSDNLSTCCQLLSEGSCDFLLCYRHPGIALALDEQIFARIDLGLDRLIPVAAAAAVERYGWRLPGTVDRPIPHLAYDRGSFLRAVVDQLLGERPGGLDVRHMDAFTEALKSLALRGQGIAWLPESAVQPQIEAGLLVQLSGAEWTADLTLSLFAAPDFLDEQGQQIWHAFGSASAKTFG